jgi:hypothetical protein
MSAMQERALALLARVASNRALSATLVTLLLWAVGTGDRKSVV